MTFTYSFDANDMVARVRLYLGDTVQDQGVKPDGQNLSDEEIQAVLNDNDNELIPTVINFCDMLAVMFSNFGDTEIGTRREKIGQVTLRYQLMGEKLREQYGIGVAMKAAPVIRVDGYSNDIPNNQVDDLTSGEYA